MVVQCTIEFDNNPTGTYYGGQFVTGTVALEVDKPKQLKGVVLKIQGYAHTGWSESTSTTTNGKSSSSSTHYSGDEKYISSTTFLMGTPDSNECTLDVGVYRFTFSCHVPSMCPSSYECINGHVRYLVKVVLVRPWKFDQTFTKGFTVLKTLDLNYQPALAMPSHTEVTKQFGIGVFKSDPLTIKVDLPQGGYVPGQNIPVQVLISNDSNSAVLKLKIRLVLEATLFTDSPCSRSRQELTTVSKLGGNSVMRNSRSWFVYELPVPPGPPSDLDLCRLIKINYIVEVEAKMPTFRPNQVICVPVTIGNVPILKDFPSEQFNAQPQIGWGPTVKAPSFPQLTVAKVSAPSTEATGSNPTEGGLSYSKELEAHQGATAATSAVPCSPSVLNGNIPPPSYEEAIYMPQAKINDDEKHDYGDTVFTPRYPVFDIPSPTIEGSAAPRFCEKDTTVEKTK